MLLIRRTHKRTRAGVREKVTGERNTTTIRLFGEVDIRGG